MDGVKTINEPVLHGNQVVLLRYSLKAWISFLVVYWAGAFYQPGLALVQHFPFLTMPKLRNSYLDLTRCPHCNVDSPSLTFAGEHVPKDWMGVPRFWRVYECGRCAGLVMATARSGGEEVTAVYPQPLDVSEEIPERARAYLDQAVNSLSAPAGAVMLAASAVDAMLKNKGLVNGSLYTRIDQAVKQNLITPDMAQWAHEVRLEANDQRHADDKADLPTPDDAKKCVDFAMALGQFIFVLPARIQRGIENAKAS